jgi:transcriptional antiterminator NusG
MTDEEARQEEELEAGAEISPPLSGAPDENPPDLEEHLEEALEAESEEFTLPQEEVENEAQAVDEIQEEEAESAIDDDEQPAITELAAEETEAEVELADEMEEVEAEAGEEEEAEAEGEEATDRPPDLDELQASLKAASEEQDQPEEEEEDGRHWYVIHCYSGQENKVRHNLEQRIDTMGMKDRIFDVVVPTEEEIEVKDGKRRTVERRVFPGYILVQMILTEDSWYVVRNTPGVTGFVGMGNEPTPLRPEEVSQIIKRMEAEAPRIKVTYKIGQKVRIIDGPFNDFIGTVDDIDMERAKVRVMVSFFGRETPVELDFLQVEKA